MAREPVDYYAVLQVNPSATLPVVEAAYQAVVRARGADGGDPDPLVHEAYQVLSDPELRDSYDRWYVNWTTNNPEQVRAEARRRARREAARRARASRARFAGRTAAQGAALRTTLGDSAVGTRRSVGANLEGVRRAREARRARAREKTGWRRRIALHPVLSVLVGLLTLSLVVAGVAVPLQVAAERADREEQRLAEVAAQEEAERAAEEEAARVAAAEEAERVEQEALAAEEAEREAEEARAAEEAEAERKAEEARAAAEAEAKEEADEQARAECLDAVAAGEADLSGCDFTGADLRDTDLSGRDLTGANLIRADLTGAILEGAVLHRIAWTSATCPDGSRSTGLRDGCADSLLLDGDADGSLAIGEPAEVGDWTVTVSSYQANAQSTARAVERFNNPPGEGFVYAIVGLSVTYDGTGQNEIPASNLDVGINDVADGDPDTSCYLAGVDGKYDQLNTGQSTAYEICLYLPEEKATGGVIGVYDGYSFESDEPAVLWAIP